MFKRGFTSKAKQDFLQKFNVAVLEGFHSSDMYLVRADVTGEKLRALAEDMAKDPAVANVETNQIVRALGVPNDPAFSQVYGMSKIQAPALWDSTVGSKQVTVTVIDTGVDYTHPDLAGNIDMSRAWDFIHNNSNAMDDNGHGTHCAGIIGAVGNNGLGVVGVNWNVTIVPIKFIGSDGSGQLSDAVHAIEYSTAIGAAISSNSWGGGGYSPALEAAMKAGSDAGVLWVVAAGNSATNNDESPNSFPANLDIDGILSVAATDTGDYVASFSNFGKSRIHVAAPGVGILSTFLKSDYKSLNGTSMATPHVAGAAALLKSLYPNITAQEMKRRLIYSSDMTAHLATKVYSAGRINVFRAAEADATPPATLAGVDITSLNARAVRMNWKTVGDDGMSGLARHYLYRISPSPIVSEDDWSRASYQFHYALTGTATNVTVDVDGLPLQFQGYVSVRAVDDVGNMSALATSAAFSLPTLQVMATQHADTMDQMVAQTPWGFETLADGSVVFSDSPGTLYAPKMNTSLTWSLPAGTTYREVYLTMHHLFDLEPCCDRAFLEISTDGGASWKKVTAFSGSSVNFRDSIIALHSFWNGKTPAKLRFRLQTDPTNNADGWKIGGLSVFGRP
jgi:subtilisin family serine protease